MSEAESTGDVMSKLGATRSGRPVRSLAFVLRAMESHKRLEAREWI